MYDVAIIGGGVCGCSLLYALSRYNLRAVLCEATNDVGTATTKANSAILHAGYDPEPGTLMAKYNVEGSRLCADLCRDLDILYSQCGSLVVAFTVQDEDEVQCLYDKGVRNGVQGMRIVRQPQLAQMEPHLAKNARCALFAPSAAVVNPWELASAQAEMAVQNGAGVLLDSPVTAISYNNEGATPYYALATPGGEVRARFVVNAAGVHADAVAEMAAACFGREKPFTIFPSRGQYYLMDKSQHQLASHVIFQCPDSYGKGVLVAPTVHGNLIVGPNAEAATDVDTTESGLAYVKEKAVKSVPDIDWRQSIRNFAGLRANASGGDFIVGPQDGAPGFYNMAGIKSPGLTSAPAIALDIVDMLREAGLPLEEKPDFISKRKINRFNHMAQPQRADIIRENPLYGRIVCRCETITEGDIVAALHRPLPPRSLDAVKRRCGPGMGRCQGGFCGPRVQAIIARELGLTQAEVPLDRTGMDIITGRTKDDGAKEGGTNGGGEC